MPWDGQSSTAVAGALMVAVVGEDLTLGWRKGHLVVTASTVGGRWRSALQDRLAKGGRAAIRNGEAAISAAFDTDALTAEFFSDVRRLVAEYVGQVVVALSPQPVEPAGRPGRRVEYDYLLSLLARLVITLCLQSKGWFEFRGRMDYLQALYEDSKQNPRSMRFLARLAHLSSTGILIGDGVGRKALGAALGKLPCVGKPFRRSPETDELLMLPGQAYEVPEGIFESVLGQCGLAEKYPFDARRPVAGQRRLAIDLEAASHVIDSLRFGTPLVMRERLRARCRNEIAEFLGTTPELDDLRPEWRQELENFHVLDPSCGTGEYLVGMVHELVELKVRLEEAFGDSPPQPLSIVRSVIENTIRGIEAVPAKVFLSQVRMLNAAITWDESEHPSARPRIEDSILLGQLAGRGDRRRQLPFHEGALVEFKASFDWSTHRNERDPSLRLGTLRTLCAFLNCEGGSVYLGVDDSGSVVGIDDELLRFNCDNPRDQFETRVRQYVREAIDPPPLGALDIEFETYGRRTVCVLSVAPRPGITYLVQRKPSGRIEDIVYVRDGNRTVRLEGRSRDRFVIARCAPSP